MSRPSSFTEDLGDLICELLIEGKSLRQICDDSAMPSRSTVLRWKADIPSFATKYAHAREMQADFMDDLILEAAMVCTAESAQADRVRIAAFQWRASKLMPKVYGDRLDVNATVSRAAEDMTDAQLAAIASGSRSGASPPPGDED